MRIRLFSCLLMALAGVATLAARASEPQAPRPVGVLVSGSDHLAAGALQQKLETRLAVQSHLEVHTVSELASVIGVPEDGELAEPDPETAQRIDALLEKARQRYYDGDHTDARQLLEEAGALINKADGADVDRRVKLGLWSAAVYLAQDNRDKAVEDARDVIRLQPSVEVDRVAFPPSVVTLVQETRRLTETATISLHGLPDGARVWIDGRKVANPDRLEIPVGAHRLRVSAPGYHALSVPVDVDSDTAVKLALPLALDPADEKVLAEAVRRGRGDSGAIALLETFANRIGVHTWVVAHVSTGGVRALLWDRNAPETEASALLPNTAEGKEALARWAGAQLPAPSEDVDTGPPLVGATGDSFWSLEASWIVRVRTRQIRGGDDVLIRSAFNGMGPRIGALYQSAGGWRFFTTLDLLSYNFRPPTFTLADGSTVTQGGGGGSKFEIGGGHEWVIGKQMPLLTFYADLGLWGERILAEDIVSDTGPLGVFPNVVHSGVELRLGGRTWIRSVTWKGSPLELQLQIYSSPLTSFQTTPDDAFGTEPRPRPATGFLAAAAMNPGRWHLALGYENERREVFFSGQTRAPYDPAVTSPHIVEVLYSLTLVAGRRF